MPKSLFSRIITNTKVVDNVYRLKHCLARIKRFVNQCQEIQHETLFRERVISVMHLAHEICTYCKFISIYTMSIKTKTIAQVKYIIIRIINPIFRSSNNTECKVSKTLQVKFLNSSTAYERKIL